MVIQVQPSELLDIREKDVSNPVEAPRDRIFQKFQAENISDVANEFNQLFFRCSVPSSERRTAIGKPMTSTNTNSARSTRHSPRNPDSIAIRTRYHPTRRERKPADQRPPWAPIPTANPTGTTNVPAAGRKRAEAMRCGGTVHFSVETLRVAMYLDGSK